MTAAKLTGPALHRALLRDFRTLYDTLLKRQNGVCAICGRPPKTRRLDIDHDHHTHELRGLLCHRCNRQLPSWVDREWLVKAYHYLEDPPARRLEP